MNLFRDFVAAVGVCFFSLFYFRERERESARTSGGEGPGEIGQVSTAGFMLSMESSAGLNPTTLGS